MKAKICKSMMSEGLLSIRDEAGSAYGFRLGLKEDGFRNGDRVIILLESEYEILREAAFKEKSDLVIPSRSTSPLHVPRRHRFVDNGHGFCTAKIGGGRECTREEMAHDPEYR